MNDPGMNSVCPHGRRPKIEDFTVVRGKSNLGEKYSPEFTAAERRSSAGEKYTILRSQGEEIQSYGRQERRPRSRRVEFQPKRSQSGSSKIDLLPQLESCRDNRQASKQVSGTSATRFLSVYPGRELTASVDVS
jgi:hypothetical protein